MGGMRTAKISELKAKLSAHIEYVKRGEEVLILDRDTPVARLVPALASEDARLKDLIARGIITPPIAPRAESDPWPEPAGPTKITRETMERVWHEERDGR
jgi:antitoxin (DNA-binding transcriptional repressor) of toxin-antitoxin stability system